MPIPLLIISDAPSSNTGLGRIARDLTVRIHEHLPSVFRVGCLGYGGPGSRKFGFQEYFISQMEDWVIPQLPEVWADFAGAERGIVLTIWDASRLKWFAQPETLPLCPVREFLQSANFERWGYFPIDAVGPKGKLSKVREVFEGYDRILAYSEWAARIVQTTLESPVNMSMSITELVKALPHGIDTSVFRPYDRRECKAMFRDAGFKTLQDDSFLVGIVATNQARKDFALGIEAAAELKEQGRDVCLWIHTDVLQRAWDIPALLYDFGFVGKAVVTFSNFPDEQMAKLYSACDVTFGIGSGEGFGYPIFESLACGTPVIHGEYGGATEYIHSWMICAATAWRYEGQYNCRRPVFDPEDWADAAAEVTNARMVADVKPHFLLESLAWQNLWPKWEEWFLDGAARFEARQPVEVASAE